MVHCFVFGHFRYTNIQEKAADALRLLEFRLTEKEKLSQLKSVSPQALSPFLSVKL